MASADIYLDRINLRRYEELREDSRCQKFFELVERAEEILPKVPIPELPVPSTVGVIEIGDSSEKPFLVTGNSIYTHMLLGAILDYAKISAKIVSIDTDGYTVDMAVLLEKFRGYKVKEVLLKNNTKPERIIIPGFASKLKKEIEDEVGCEVIVGPECAVELPLFLEKLRRSYLAEK